MVYQVLLPLLPLMRTSRLPVVDWTDTPANLNGLVRCAEGPNLVSARVPSHFRHALPWKHIWICSGKYMDCPPVQRRQSPLHCNEDRALYIATKTEPSTLQRRQSPLHCNDDRALYIATKTEPSTLQRRQSPLHCNDDRALYIGWSVTDAVSSLTLLREMREQSSTEEGTKFTYA